MLCEIAEPLSFPIIWLVLAGVGWCSVLSLSTSVFWYLYWKPDYRLWQCKSNPKYPSCEIVRDEIFQCNKGLLVAVLCPAITIWLSSRGYSKGFCGDGGYTWWQHVLIQLAFWFVTDFIEFYYHRCTHTMKALWKCHKYHHLFFNPSPFAVIADEFVDQFIRAAPMLVWPLFLPINIDMMFVQMGVVSYGYGVYLHSGHELNWPDAHHPYINTSFSHYIHHAASVYKKPYHTGFMLKIFDTAFGSIYTKECVCVKCVRAKGERSLELWEKLPKPDYSPLLTPGFWLEGFRKETNAFMSWATSFLGQKQQND